MKTTLYILLFQCIAICIFSDSARAQRQNKDERTVLRITKKNAALLDSINQLLVVFNETPEINSATLVALEKKDKHWSVISKPMLAGIGRNGFAAPNEKREGDGKSPTGFFRLGQLFCYEKIVNTRMPYIQTTEEDKWIDDPGSADYNHHIRGISTAKSYENLKLNNNAYKYCMVIEYNMHPVIKGMGSAIFFHINENENPNPTEGCVALNQQDMEWVLNWMNPESKPSILMGNEKVLITGTDRKKH